MHCIITHVSVQSHHLQGSHHACLLKLAFTDHFAVTLRLNLDIPIFRRGRGTWKLNTSLLDAKGSKQKLETRWAGWTRQKRYFPELTMWWCRLTKKNIKHFYMQGVYSGMKLKKRKISTMHASMMYSQTADRKKKKKRPQSPPGQNSTIKPCLHWHSKWVSYLYH